MARLAALTQLVVAGSILTLACAGPAVATEPPPACATAAQLVDHALPRRALVAVEAARAASGVAGDCREQEYLARWRLYQSSELSQQAAEELADEDWDAAKTAAQKALALDSENTTATEQLRRATTRKAAQDEADKTWIQMLQDQWGSFEETYIAPAGALLLPLTLVFAVLLVLTRLLVNLVPAWPEADDLPPVYRRRIVVGAGLLALVSGAWSLSVSTSNALVPTTHPAIMWPTTVLGFVAGLMACSAAVNVTPEKRLERAVQDVLVLLGVAAALGGAFGIIIQGMGGDDLSDALEAVVMLFYGATLSALGASLMAWWLATRIRVGITVTDSTGSSRSAKVAMVAAYLNELGAERPKGLEVPSGTDVTALEGAFSTLPDNAVLRAVKSFITGISGVTPWAATIDAGADSVAVAVRRNGRSQDSAVIAPKTLLETAEAGTASKISVKGKEGTSPSTGNDGAKTDSLDELALKFAAAHILATMAEGHQSIREGLAGATDWTSIGLHYIATTDPQYSGSKQQELLAKAVDADPNNQSAALAFRHSMYRQSTSREDLSQYLRWLGDFDTSLGRKIRYENATLRLRTRYTQAAIALNALFALPLATPPTSEQERDRKASLCAAKEAYKHLHEAITEAIPINPQLRHFCAQFHSDMQPSRHLLGLETGDVPESGSIFGLYNLGCYYASQNDIHLTGAAKEVSDEDESKAVSYLMLARTLPELRDWMAKDPQLAAFVKRSAYQKALLAKPRTDLLDLEPFTSHAEQLRAAGYSDPVVLSGVGPTALATLLDVDRAVSSYLVELARLRAGVPAGPDPWAVEVIADLHERGMARGDRLRGLNAEGRTKLAQGVAAAVLGRCTPFATDPATNQSDLAALLTAWFATA